MLLLLVSHTEDVGNDNDAASGGVNVNDDVLIDVSVEKEDSSSDNDEKDLVDAEAVDDNECAGDASVAS